MTYAIIFLLGLFVGALLANKNLRTKVFALIRETVQENKQGKEKKKEAK